MICPNKNSKEYKDLMDRYGDETLATIHYFKSGNVKAKTNTDIKLAIRLAVESDPVFYAGRYATYLNPITGGDNNVITMTEAFALRFEGIDGNLRGDVVETLAGNMLLFPEASADFRNADSIPTSMDKMLNVLSKKFNIPFRVVHEPNQKWAGRYVNDGDSKIVYINTAYATESTPIHEYFHPFVRILKVRNNILYNSILSQARGLGDDRTDEDEVITDYLENQSKKRAFSSYLSQFFTFIRRILNISPNVTIDSATTLKDLFKVAEQGLDLSKENTLTSAYKKVDILIDDIENKISRSKTKPVDYIEKIRADNPKLVTDDDSNTYKDLNGNEVATRLTVFVGDKEHGAFSTKSRRFKESYPVALTRDLFASRGIDVKDKKPEDITETVLIDGQPKTFAEAVKIEEERTNKGRIYGKMVHAFMQYLLETDVPARKQAKEAALGYAKEYGQSFYTLEMHENLRPLQENLDEIIKVAGLKIDVDGTLGIPKNKQDKIASEIILKSNLLVDTQGKPIATTADGIVQHSNGDMSLLDWKTGGITSDMNTPYLMQYGEKYDISDSKVARGYLELAFRALMLKEQYPDMAFRKIQLIRLDHKGNATAMTLDLQPYLYTIGDFYKAKYPAIYEQLQNRGLLDATKYEGVDAPLDNILDRIQHLEYDDQVLYLKTKLASLHKGKSKAQIERYSNLATVSAAYTNALLDVEKIAGLDLKAKSNDIPTYPFIGGFKNFSDISNTKVQTLHKLLMEAKAKITSSNLSYDKQHAEVYKALVIAENPALKKSIDFVALAALTTSLFTFSFVGVGLTLIAHKVATRYMNQTTKQHFAFMWRKSDDPANPGYFLNTANNYESDGVWKEMTEAQKNYRDFIRTSMMKEYDKFAYTVVGYRNNDENRPIYRYQDLNLPDSLPADFMPRIPKDISEVREEEAFLANFAGLKTVLGDSVKKGLTSFLEDTYSNQDSPIPLKYFKHSGSTAVKEGNHS